MNNETEKFLDVLTTNLVELKDSKILFKEQFKIAVTNTVDKLTKKELAEVITYMLFDFREAETEMNKELDKHAGKNKKT
jgi:hypothetical protein